MRHLKTALRLCTNNHPISGLTNRVAAAPIDLFYDTLLLVDILSKLPVRR